MGTDTALKEIDQYKLTLWKFLKVDGVTYGPNRAYTFSSATDQEAWQRVAEALELPFPFSKKQLTGKGGSELYRLENGAWIYVPLSH